MYFSIIDIHVCILFSPSIRACLLLYLFALLLQLPPFATTLFCFLLLCFCGYCFFFNAFRLLHSHLLILLSLSLSSSLFSLLFSRFHIRSHTTWHTTKRPPHTRLNVTHTAHSHTIDFLYSSTTTELWFTACVCFVFFS